MKKFKDPEEFLRKFSLKPPPEALKKRIIDAVEREQKEFLYLKPVFWKVVLFAGFLSLIIFTLDNRINHIQFNNLTSKLGIIQVQKNNNQIIQKELMEEIFNGFLKEKKTPWMKRYLTPENQKEKLKNNIKLHLFFEEEINED